MANKKYKLTDGNMWATDGIHDFGQNKTQRTINSEVNSALGGKAPTNHASTATTYGAASTSNYGHVKLSNTTPSMDGTAAVGDSTDVARANHVHPSDTSRVPTTRKINGMDLSQDRTLTSENIGYNSSTTYSSGTVGKAVSDLNGAITTVDTQTNSVEWTPANGDTLLAFILANCTRTKLPFSFVKIGNNTVPDAPTAIRASEFTGTVYGYARRITVQIRKYNNADNSVYQRTIFENNWYGIAWTRYVNTEDLTQISISSEVSNTNDTFQIPNFGSHKVYTIIARRWGYIASVVITKDFITGNLAGAITLDNTSGQGKITVLNVSATGLITVTSTDDGIILGVIASSPVA